MKERNKGKGKRRKNYYHDPSIGCIIYAACIIKSGALGIN